MSKFITQHLNPIVHHIKYNTGDQIWYTEHNDKKTVTKLITTDGITWQTGQESLQFPTIPMG